MLLSFMSYLGYVYLVAFLFGGTFPTIIRIHVGGLIILWNHAS